VSRIGHRGKDMLCIAVAHVGGGPDPHLSTAQYQCSNVKNGDGDYTITLAGAVPFSRVFPLYSVVDTTGAAQATVEMDYAGVGGSLVWNLKIRRGAALVDDVHVHVLFVDLQPDGSNA